MNILKKIIFGIIALLATIVVASFFVPDKFTVKQSAHINAPVEDVFKQINDLRNWDNWNPFHTLDPNWDLQFQRRYEGEGAGYVWNGNSETVASGNLEIVSSRYNEEVVVSIHYDDENQNMLHWYLLETDERGTDISFITDFNVGLDPIKKLHGLNMKWKIKSTFEHGLERLKEIVEADAYTRQKTNQ